MAAPSAPVINEQPLAEDQKLSFQWNPQASVDNYYIYDNDGVSTLLTSVPGNITVTTVTGLTNGQTYNAFISASNVNGMGSPSFFRPFEPGLPPTIAPLNVTVTKGNSNCLIDWTATGESLAAPIRWYAIETNSTAPNTSNLRFTADGFNGQTSYLVDNLESNYGYQFTVQGVNCPGYSPVAYTSTFNFMEMGSWYIPASDLINTPILTTTPAFAFTPGLSSFTFEFFRLWTSFGTGGTDIYERYSQMFGGFFPGPYDCVFGLFQGSGITYFDYGEANQSLSINTPFVVNQWYHIALSRDISQSNVALWINGVRQGTAYSDSFDFSQSTDPFIIKQLTDSTGFLTNMNFINGVAKYNPNASTIPVPQSPFTSNVNTFALYLAKNSATSFNDETGTFSTILTAANGIAWSSTTPFS